MVSSRVRGMWAAGFVLTAALVLPALLPASGAAAVSAPLGPITPGSGTVTVSGFVLSGVGPAADVQVTSQSGQLALTSSSGLVVDAASTTSKLVFSGSQTDINAALSGLTYTRTGAAADTIVVSVAGAGQFFCAATGHTYEFVQPPGGVDWDTAFADSAAMFGGSGYLATITSSDENECIFAVSGTNAWFGADARATSGAEWVWSDGPEVGTTFWTGDFTGSAVSGGFSAWDLAGNQPQNDPGQLCAQYFSFSAVSTWHDNGCGATNSYVAEVDSYSGLASASLAVLAVPAPATASGPSLAPTGSEMGISWLLALSAMAVGTVLMVTTIMSARRRGPNGIQRATERRSRP